ncbi:MAG TPA: protein phosphatase 2C domain-containing protein [Gammaproteobacteria bacterium]|nr:protein phosphatase 2C domain-containing protein [Gammaproteobacteria bacterium]
MNLDTGTVSLTGDRKENQDRVATIRGDGAALLVVVDGMGGHSHGANAAQLTVDTLRACFATARKPLLDPQGFLTMALALAHDAVVALGNGLPLDQRPRATCAVCLVQDGASFWAHVGDSRVYHVRSGAVRERTRDHSHVELLLREGVIEEQQMSSHPMRNLVECCLGGDSPLPDISVTAQRRLLPGDALIVCTDGLWSGVNDERIGTLAGDASMAISAALEELGKTALKLNAPHSDNTSACGMRWIAT